MADSQLSETDQQPVHIRKALETPPSNGSAIYIQDVTASITYRACMAKGIHISVQDFEQLKGTRKIYDAKAFWHECLALENRQEMDVAQAQEMLKALDNPPTDPEPDSKRQATL